MEIKQNKFAFFANFAETIRELPIEKQGLAYQALCEYGIYGMLPEDESLRAMCLMAKASLFKADGRKNNGGNHNPTGKNQFTEPNGQSGQSWSKLVKVGQSGQFLSETETETETETEKGKREKKPKADIGVPKKETLDWEYVLNRWNEIATKWKRPQMRALTEPRKKHFSARFKEYGGGIEKLFEEIDYRLETSLCLRGKELNKEGELENANWPGADFDFLCRPEKFFRILEGGYRDADLERMYEKKKQMAIEAQKGEMHGDQLFM